MLKCFWQDQDVFIEPTIDSTPCARKTPNPIFDDDKNSHGKWIKPTWWIQEEGTCYLLIDQKFNGYESRYTTIEKPMFCYGLECKKAYAIHIILHNLVVLKTKYTQHLWKPYISS